MAKITIRAGLPFVEVRVRFEDKEITLPNILVDTGSYATLFRTDAMRDMGIQLNLTAEVRRVSGVGGNEYVLEGEVSAIILDDMVAAPFPIQMGALQYGFDFVLDGILGFDFLSHVKAQIDLEAMEIRKK